MDPYLTFHQFLIVLLAGFGVFPILSFLVKWFRRIFFAFRQLRQNMSSDYAIASLGAAYAQENESKLRRADLQYAYTKLEKLSNSKTRPYYKRLAEFREVRERQLPCDEYLLRLLSNILDNQSDPEMKLEVLSYYLHVEKEVRVRIYSISVWLAAAAVGIYFLIEATLDALAAYQLSIVFIITTFIMLFPAWVARAKIGSKVIRSAIILLCLFLYFAGYSFLHHVRKPTEPKVLMGVQIEYPEWVIAPLSFNLQDAAGCGGEIVIKAAPGNTGATALPGISINPKDNTDLYDKDCKPLFQGDVIPEGAPPREALVYKVWQKSGVQSLFNNPPLKVDVTLSETASNKTETINLEMRQEHILWYYSRLGLGGLFGIVIVSGVIQSVVKAIQDATSRKLSE